MPIHWLWLVLILVLVLIIFGPSRLPELGSALGRGIREFRKASDELKDEVSKATSTTPAKSDEPAQPAQSAAPAEPQGATPPAADPNAHQA